MNLKCAICRFTPLTEGGPTNRNAEFMWEGVSVCEEHLKARRAMLLLSQQDKAQIDQAQRPVGIATP